LMCDTYERGRYRAYAFSLWRCLQCGLVRTSPIPETSMYDAHDFRNGEPVERTWLASGIEQTIDLLQSAGFVQGAILDVGCNTGEAVEALCVRGYDAEGCDIDESAIAAGRRRGRRIFVHDFESDPFPRRYMAIICIHTLEHLLNPGLLARRAADALEPGGVFFVAVPNYGGLVARLMGVNWGFMQPAEHVWQFTPVTLRATVERGGDFREMQSLRRNHLEYLTNSRKRALFAVARVLNMSDEIRAVFIRLPGQQRERPADAAASRVAAPDERTDATAVGRTPVVRLGRTGHVETLLPGYQGIILEGG
jgi:SAM-dependent methyltransferase